MRTLRLLKKTLLFVFSFGLLFSTSFAQEELDYGDLPFDHDDPFHFAFRTRLAEDGARHALGPPLFLGATVDPDPDGQPSLNADGDDLDILGPPVNDDEDGVVHPSALNVGQANQITVNASGTGLLQVWIDLNYSGSFDTAAEKVLSNYQLSIGANIVPITIPSGTLPGDTYARYRFSSVADLDHGGEAPDGEVEDYYITIESTEELDWGDAPDPAYSTLSLSNGPRHVISLLFLGQLVDAEPDGQPDANALGDDNNPAPGPDDEDGVIHISPLNPGLPATLTVIASMPGLLSAWVDFNQNGIFDVPAEQVLVDVPVIAGANPLGFVVPPGTAPGYTFERYRVSTMPGLQPTGLAPDGEVEDYQILIAEESGVDFGDAPDSYQTTIAVAGAAHQFVPMGPVLGTLIDTETDGQPTAAADGDDLNPPSPPPSDEDGVVITAPLNIGGAQPCVSVTTNTGGFLDAWIDWDQNGTFDPPEHFAGPPGTSMILAPGPNQVCFVVPGNAVVGPTYARFRLSGGGGLPPWGNAPDGEVEDYAVEVIDEPVDLDFGDAPDPLSATAGEYPTLLANDGARHVIVPALQPFMLGQLIDAETDGQPTSLADGDDLNPGGTPPGDEDGVIPTSAMLAGAVANVDVIATVPPSGAASYLNAWMDFDANGVWTDPGEHIFVDVLMTNGVNSLQYNIPNGASIGNTFARFRLATAASLPTGMAPTGQAADGEVEDYMFEIEPGLSRDFGDLPDDPSNINDFKTLFGSGGARHVVNTAIRLGALIDGEPDGQPSADARGDDILTSDDEDGVSHPGVFRMGLSDTVVVTASVPGKLSAWVDWNQSGAFDAGEQVLTDVILATGPNPLGISVPIGIPTGRVGVRYRFSTVGGLSHFGEAPDGEVEDYLMEVVETTLDWGDLPRDPPLWTYPVEFANDGPRHDATSPLFLGDHIDAELDGQPSVPANLDDITATPDDEDGVIHTSLLAPSASVAVDVVASASGWLNAWADFNDDGMFDTSAGSTEIIFSNHPVLAGVNHLVYTAPATLGGAAVYERFRLGTQLNLLPSGPANDGEVEDYKIDVTAEGFDWGDLPDDPTDPLDYQTLAGSTGPSHLIVDQCYLGTLIDADLDGQPDVNATGDDNAGANDEDGIIFLNMPWLPNTVEQMAVSYNLIGCPGAQLHCWADFEGDRDFDGLSEHIINGAILPGSGTVLPPFGVPSDLATTDVFVRCRLSTDPQASLTIGQAGNGEVEDYWVPAEILAVEVSAFEALASERSVALSWKTSSESDLAGFRIEQQDEADRWTEVGYLEARGSGDAETGYDLRLDEMAFGRHVFRLVVLNLDGSADAGPQIEILLEMTEALVLDAAYPNPFNPVAIVQFAVKEAEHTTLDLYSIDGRRVRRVYAGMPEAGVSHTVRVDGSGLPSGNYMLRLSTDSRVVDRSVTLIR